MKEHDDDLELSGITASAQTDAAQVAVAIASGLERIATAIERGFHELAHAPIPASLGAPTDAPTRRRTRRR